MKNKNSKITSTQKCLFGIDQSFQYHLILTTSIIRIDAIHYENYTIGDETKHIERNLSTNTALLDPTNIPNIDESDIMLYLANTLTPNMKVVMEKDALKTKKFIKFINFTFELEGEVLKDFCYTVYDKGLVEQHSFDEVTLTGDVFDIMADLVLYYLYEEIDNEIMKESGVSPNTKCHNFSNN